MKYAFEIRVNYNTDDDTCYYFAKLMLNARLAFSVSGEGYEDTESSYAAGRQALKSLALNIIERIDERDYVPDKIDLYRDGFLLLALGADDECTLVTYTQASASTIAFGESRTAVVDELTQALRATIADIEKLS